MWLYFLLKDLGFPSKWLSLQRTVRPRVPGESRQMAISSTCSSSCRLSFFRPTWNFTSGSNSSRVWPAAEEKHGVTRCTPTTRYGEEKPSQVCGQSSLGLHLVCWNNLWKCFYCTLCSSGLFTLRTGSFCRARLFHYKFKLGSVNILLQYVIFLFIV